MSEFCCWTCRKHKKIELAGIKKANKRIICRVCVEGIKEANKKRGQNNE